jgi:hypothetical protein
MGSADDKTGRDQRIETASRRGEGAWRDRTLPVWIDRAMMRVRRATSIFSSTTIAAAASPSSNWSASSSSSRSPWRSGRSDDPRQLGPDAQGSNRGFGRARLLTERLVQPALHAIREAIEGGEGAVRGRTLDDFGVDWLLRHGVQRGIERRPRAGFRPNSKHASQISLGRRLWVSATCFGTSTIAYQTR